MPERTLYHCPDCGWEQMSFELTQAEKKCPNCQDGWLKTWAEVIKGVEIEKRRRRAG